ncbi:MAG: hypothetical protein NTV93_18790 [Verrucomicrobia bacterium]|nr:hypothetical protein [Verrucomicrobiota bacterium]
MFARPSSPGLYGHADPREQVRWVHEFGANVMQAFCCSYNGYAWFPSDVAPVTPGLKGNFLQDQVDEGHKLGIRVMGYFCLGSNPYWARNHEAREWHDVDVCGISGDAGASVTRRKQADFNWLPFTNKYLDYFCACVRDALLKTDVDGFMIDWFKVERGPEWLDSEKEMWPELMNEPFPACSSPSPEAEIEFKRRQVERAWVRVKQTVEETRPSALTWTNQPFTKVDDPLWNGHRLLKEVDWLLNESPKTEFLDWLAANIGPHTKVLQNFCGWADHSAGNWRDLDMKRFGFYGFTKVNPATCLPWTAEQVQSHRRKELKQATLDWFHADVKNLAILRDAYQTV